MCAKLKTADLVIDTKLFIGVIANTYDNFDGALDKVSHLFICTTMAYNFKILFAKNNDRDIGGAIMNLDLKSEQNKRLKKIITNEESDDVNEEIVHEVLKLAMKLKKRSSGCPEYFSRMRGRSGKFAGGHLR